MITEYLINKSPRLLKQEPEITPGGQEYHMFNTGGVESEVGEFLYSITRLWKPNQIVETGTHLGISSAYFAKGLLDNKKGKIFTYEVIPSLRNQAMELWKSLEVSSVIETFLCPSLQAKITSEIDIAFLDSEPQFRFDEFLYFFPMVRPGGLIIIHDLHPSLGKSGLTHAGMNDWPYGPWRDKLAKFVSNHELQTLFAPNPRGCTIFQKTKPTDENIILLRE